MQSATLPGTASFTQATWKEENKFSETKLEGSARMVVGLHYTFIKLVIWLQVYVLACRYFRNPVKTFKILKGLKAIRAGMRGQQKPLKYVKVSSRYYTITTKWGRAAQLDG